MDIEFSVLLYIGLLLQSFKFGYKFTLWTHWFDKYLKIIDEIEAPLQFLFCIKRLDLHSVCIHTGFNKIIHPLSSDLFLEDSLCLSILRNWLLTKLTQFRTKQRDIDFNNFIHESYHFKWSIHINTYISKTNTSCNYQMAQKYIPWYCQLCPCNEI